MKKVPDNILLLPITMILAWIIFKLFYPYADFFSDSYTYIEAAVQRDPISVRPIGYSIFLLVVHAISTSDTFLTTLQYLLLQSACFYLLLTLRRWFGIPPLAERILLIFLILNLPAMYLCNYVSSDALFTALSLVWITELLRLIEQPSWRKWIVQIMLLVLLFYLRFSALCYPLVSAAAFLLCRKRSLTFIASGMVTSILVVLAGMTLTRYITGKNTGTPVYSAFSGWEIANNALNIYPYIPVDTTGLPSPACRELVHDFVRPYFDTAAQTLRKDPPAVTTDYMWDRRSPLHLYMATHRNLDHLDYFKAWNKVSPLFSQYGWWVIRQHPWPFARYYIWPGAGRYFLPMLVVMEVYNEKKDTVDLTAQKWFGYPTAHPGIRCSATIQATLLTPFRWLFLLVNVLFLLAAGLFAIKRQLRTRYPAFTRALWFTGSFFLINTGFSLLAAPSELRYEIIPFILLFVITTCALTMACKTATK